MEVTHTIRISDSDPAEELRRQGQLRVEIKGRSMEPLLKSGRNTVHLRCLRDAPKPLDVVLFCREDGSFVLHRVLACGRDGFTICGDHQTEPERGIQRRQIVGRMEGYYAGNRYHSCRGVGYRLYARIWSGSLPLRKLWAALRRRAREAST